MLRKVMLLALEFHWSRAEIMALPLAEFEFYTDQISEILKAKS